MRRMSDTIARLEAAAERMQQGFGNVGATRLTPLSGFGPNPGGLTGWSHVPDGSAPMPLVVVLHGCTQTAAGYDAGSGWSDLADRFGFALLYPEQTRANNPNTCFNWFVPEDTRRDGGEAASIRQMITAMVERHAIDATRIFITGLSAGGAMTSVMLATYPEVFAGGAIIAGLPFGAAASMPQAFDRMRGHGHSSDEASAAAIRAASPHRGAWPRVSVWHGSADATVTAANADHIIGQWRALHALPPAPTRDTHGGGDHHRMWCDDTGRIMLEDHRIAGMGHGTPLGTTGETASGRAMPYMLDVGISSTWHIADGWGLLGVERMAAPVREPVMRAEPARADPRRAVLPTQPGGVQATIEAALRSAGLMR